VFTGKEGKGLNVAVSGSEANNMPLQAARLIQRFKESNDIDFEKDWKLVTIFIGRISLFHKSYATL
jgi:phospholipase B1